MAGKSKGTVTVKTHNRTITIDPLRPLAPLHRGKRQHTPGEATGHMMLEERGSRRFIVPGTVEPGRYPGLESIFPRKER